jgi:hypothetical protein
MTTSTAIDTREQLRQAMLAAQREMEQAEQVFKLSVKRYQNLRWDWYQLNEVAAIRAQQDSERSKRAERNKREAEQERKRAELIEVLPSLQFYR